MLKVKITVFKDTGKFYTDAIVYNDTDIPLWTDEFKTFIKDNMPLVCIPNGYIVVEDVGDGEGFHMVLYKTEDLL